MVKLTADYVKLAYLKLNYTFFINIDLFFCKDTKVDSGKLISVFSGDES